MGPKVTDYICPIWVHEEEFKNPWLKLYIKALEIVFQYLGGIQ